MRPLPTPEQMAAADRAAIASGTSAETLMERAGRAVARAALDVAGYRYGLRVAVVCGKGNNGGDGFVAARALKREGADVRCLTVGDVESSEGAAAHHLNLWRQTGGAIEPFEVDALDDVDVAIDAIFGTGFRGVAEGEAAQAIEALSNIPASVIAVDIPSGVNGTTGACDGGCVQADVTIAMGAEKIGTAIGDGAAAAGQVIVADIGIPVSEHVAQMVEHHDVVAAIPSRPPTAHKRSSGSVVVLAGSDAMPGAALLTARAALRAGAGYVNLVTTQVVATAAAETVPELVVKVASDSDVLVPDAIERAKDFFSRADAVAIGPGLGTGQSQRELVERLLREIDLPVVIDADGLNVLAEDTSPLAARTVPAVLTPHPAELARLLQTSTGDVQESRLGAVSEAAERYGCVVLLKGHRSLVAAPGRGVVVIPTGGPELATAGTGDVLTGAVAAYLAAGVDPFIATWAAAYVHGAAGELARDGRGARGVIATDVAEQLGNAAQMIVEDSWS